MNLRNRDRHYDPTEEELEAIIAEQMQNLPAWWHKEHGKLKEQGMQQTLTTRAKKEKR